MRIGIRTVAAALALGLLLAPAGAGTLIDDFSQGELSIEVKGVGNSVTDIESGLNVLGGERKTRLEVTASYYDLSAVAERKINHNVIAWINNSTIGSELTLTYGASADLDADFSGAANVVADIVELDNDASISITLDDGTTAHAVVRSAEGPGVLRFPVSEYIAAGVTVAHVDTIVVHCSGDVGLDMDLTLLGTEPYAEIGGQVWLDEDGDGQRNGELPKDGVEVELYACDHTNTPTGDPLEVTETLGGEYFFSELPPGDYAVHVIRPAGYEFTTQDAPGVPDDEDSDVNAEGWTPCFPLPAGEKQYNWDAGLTVDPELLAAIGDFVWEDTNEDGIQDEGEPGMDGVAVSLYDCDDNLKGTTTTSGGGMYSFSSLPPGDYYVEFILPDGYVFSPQDQTDDDLDSDAHPTTGQTACTTLDPGETDNTWDAGMIQESVQPGSGSIGDTVWQDLDEDGIQDPDEPGAPDVTVILYDCEGGELATTVTDEEGTYSFTNLEAGAYFLLFVRPIGNAFTLQDQGTHDGLDSDAERATGYTVCFALRAGEDQDTWDAGLVEGDDEPHGGGKWKNTDPEDWPLDGLTLGDNYYTVDELIILMDRPPKKGDARIILVHQLIPAMTSVANGADPTGVQGLIAAANEWLIAYPLPEPPLPPAGGDWGDGPPKGDDRDAMIELAELLDDWNSGGSGGPL